MPQLHCYVPDKLAKRLEDNARKAHLSVSKYLAMIVTKEVGNQWPAGYFELFGAWHGEALKRPTQEDFEQRADFD